MKRYPLRNLSSSAGNSSEPLNACEPLYIPCVGAAQRAAKASAYGFPYHAATMLLRTVPIPYGYYAIHHHTYHITHVALSAAAVEGVTAHPCHMGTRHACSGGGQGGRVPTVYVRTAWTNQRRVGVSGPSRALPHKVGVVRGQRALTRCTRIHTP